MSLKKYQDNNYLNEQNDDDNNQIDDNEKNQEDDIKLSTNNYLKRNEMNDYEKEKDGIKLNFDYNNANDNIASPEEKEYNRIGKTSNNDNNNNDTNLTISNLLFQLKQMSDKQLYLLDIISNLQKNSSEQINNLNNRIKDLEEKLIKQNDNNSNNVEKREVNHLYKGENPSTKLIKLLNGNNNERLIKCLNELKLEQIKNIDIKLIEDILMKLCILLTEGFKVHEIISFIKSILIVYKIKLKKITKKNLSDVLNYIQRTLETLKEEDSIDISLIISYLNNK